MELRPITTCKTCSRPLYSRTSIGTGVCAKCDNRIPRRKASVISRGISGRELREKRKAFLELSLPASAV